MPFVRGIGLHLQVNFFTTHAHGQGHQVKIKLNTINRYIVKIHYYWKRIIYEGHLVKRNYYQYS